MTILIAEDDYISRKVLASQLKKLGHEVLEAEDGGRAWDLLRERSVPVVITDWMMPGVDGPEFCRRIRAREDGPYVYVLMLTAIDRETGYVEGIEAGADDFVVKPCSVDELQIRLHVAARILSLQEEANQLKGLFPICPKCKKIEAGEKGWQPAEGYIMKKTDALFSHGICPDCYEKYMKPQLAEFQKKAGT